MRKVFYIDICEMSEEEIKETLEELKKEIDKRKNKSETKNKTESYPVSCFDIGYCL